MKSAKRSHLIGGSRRWISPVAHGTLKTEVSMAPRTAPMGAEQIGPPGPEGRESLDEQARRRGIRPVRRVEDMARDDVFESDEELDAFLVWVYSERQANVA
jgi:hypothetical protein